MKLTPVEAEAIREVLDFGLDQNWMLERLTANQRAAVGRVRAKLSGASLYDSAVDVLKELADKAAQNGERAERLGPTTEGKVAAHVESAYRDAADLVASVIGGRS